MGNSVPTGPSIKLYHTYPFHKELEIPLNPSLTMKDLVVFAKNKGLIHDIDYFDWFLERGSEP